MSDNSLKGKTAFASEAVVFFSIIVPARNVEKEIRECIGSILEQSFGDFELLAICNNSSDATESLLREAAMMDSRVIVITESMPGPSRARNVGLDHARGRYVVFVDGDDALHPESLRVLHDIANRQHYPAAIGYGYKIVENIPPNAKEIPGKRENLKYQINPSEYYLDSILRGRLPISVWSKCIRLDVVSELRFDESISMGEDLVFSIDLSSRLDTFCACTAMLYFYRQRSSSLMNTTDSEQRIKNFMMILLVMERARQALSSQNDANIRQFLLPHFTRHFERLAKYKCDNAALSALATGTNWMWYFAKKRKIDPIGVMMTALAISFPKIVLRSRSVRMLFVHRYRSMLRAGVL